MNKELVSFGNYLLKKCKVKGFDVDGELSLNREVTHSDISNWRDEYGGEFSLPSQYQVGDAIYFSLTGNNFIYGWIVCAKFYQGKVKYDLELTLDDKSSTRIYNIDSIYVYPFTGYNK